MSRYDTVTGEEIEISRRIGLLDRKLRVLSENVDSEIEWYSWAKKAFQSIYGFEWQGDNLLLARENLLLQSSDWPFLITTWQAKDYATDRFREHVERFEKIANKI